MRLSFSFYYTLLCCLFCLVPSIILAKPAPTEQLGYSTITAPELKEMIEEEEVVVVHTLSRIEYEIQHIKDSINIPVVEMASTDKLPADLSIPLVFYCMGTR
jgi:predicted sulfurtransferase